MNPLPIGPIDFTLWIAYIDAGLIACFGGIANYFYYIDKHQIKFKIKHLLTSSLLAYFVGIVGFIFLPDTPNKFGYLLLGGFFCYRIIEFVEKNGEKILKAVFKKNS